MAVKVLWFYVVAVYTFVQCALIPLQDHTTCLAVTTRSPPNRCLIIITEAGAVTTNRPQWPMSASPVLPHRMRPDRHPLLPIPRIGMRKEKGIGGDDKGKYRLESLITIFLKVSSPYTHAYLRTRTEIDTHCHTLKSHTYTQVHTCKNTDRDKK